MTSSYSEKITKVKNALENVFVKKTDIQNNLTSTDTNKPLSANQGKILNTNKVDKISGKSLSTNDFTNTYKTKLDNLDTLLESKASNIHTHGNLQNDGSVGTSNNINKNVVTDGNGKITTEDKPQIDNTVTQNSSNAVKSSGIYSALQNKQNNLSSLDSQTDIYGNVIFDDNGGIFYSTNNRIYYDWENTNELHFINSNEDDVNFDDISLNGHPHNISNITNLQSTLNNKLETSDLLDLIYPIGSIYMEKDTASHSVCPIQITLGGTWTRIENRFLYASENGQGLGTTGGSADAVVVEHNHTQNAHNHKPSDSSYNFVTAEGGTNFALYAKHGLPTTSGSYCTMYASSQGTVTEPNTTGNTTATNIKTGVDGTGKNMPPYVIVNVWERTA